MINRLLVVTSLSVVLMISDVRVNENLSTFSQGKEKVQNTPAGLVSGDIIFQTTTSGQSKAIQMATHSPYSHCGVIFFENNKCYVWEAGPVVTKTEFQKFTSRGKDGKYVIKRLKDHHKIMGSEKSLAKMADLFYKNYYQKPYDLFFGWSDDKIYCSELVWKLYKESAGIEIGKPEKMRDFDLSSPLVQQQLKERYGNNIPLDEQVISPARIYNSDLLETVSVTKKQKL